MLVIYRKVLNYIKRRGLFDTKTILVEEQQ